MKQPQIIEQEEWLRVLTKGMVTIPKAWREEFGFNEGKIIKARKLPDKIVIEPATRTVPYRIYSQEELAQFVRRDKLPKSLERKISKKFSSK